MTIAAGVNGFGRMGRLALRVLCERGEVDVIHINEPAGDTTTLAHLLEFDSIHGRWQHEVSAANKSLRVDGHSISVSNNTQIADTDWSQCDVVIEASGKIKTGKLLQGYLDQGVERVVVTAPIKEPDILNVVIGVNHQRFDPDQHPIVTAASCTTNCLAPVVKVIHENLEIVHGSMTTIHDITNTQSVLDTPHRDLRRARASSLNLIPTTTGSATAITQIFPELEGRLNGHAVRVPLANASLTDCVFEVKTPTDAAAVNHLLSQASKNELQGILGYEKRPLVSSDYKTDPRSSIVDALSTMVVHDTHVKIFAWYDNEWGYVNRIADLVNLVTGQYFDKR